MQRTIRLVEKNPAPQNELSVKDALEALRKRGRNGRKLAKAFSRLQDNRVKTKVGKVGIVAALLQLGDPAVRKVLIREWVTRAKKGFDETFSQVH